MGRSSGSDAQDAIIIEDNNLIISFLLSKIDDEISSRCPLNITFEISSGGLSAQAGTRSNNSQTITANEKTSIEGVAGGVLSLIPDVDTIKNASGLAYLFLNQNRIRYHYNSTRY